MDMSKSRGFPADSTTNGEDDEHVHSAHKQSPQNGQFPEPLTIEAKLKKLEKHVDNLVAGQMKIMKMLEKLTVANKGAGKVSHRRISPTLHKPSKVRPPSVSDMSTLLHLPLALQDNIHLFTKDLVFTKETELPDKLLEKECLSEDDYERICSKTTTVDQVRLLIRKIKDKGPQIIETFLEVLDETSMYSHLARKVKETTEKIAEEHKGIPACAVCVMKACVDIKDIVDHLWREHMISDDMHGQIVEGDNMYKCRSSFWDQVTFSINRVTDKEKALDVLKNALNSHHYTYIVEYLDQIPKESKFTCCCCKRRGLRPRPSNSFYESESEYSATCISVKHTQNLPSYDLIYTNSAEITSPSEYSSMEQSFPSKMSFDTFHLSRFDSIGSRTQDSFDMCQGVDSPRGRHMSGNFVPQISVQYDSEEQRSLQYLHEQMENHTIPPDDATSPKPEYHRCISKQSNVTLQGDKTDHSSSSAENTYDTAYKRSSTSDGATNSPDEAQDNNVLDIAENNTVEKIERLSDTTEQTNTNSQLATNLNATRDENVTALKLGRQQRLESDKDGFADVEEDFEKDNAYKRRNRFRCRRNKILQRKATPFAGGSFVTDSKPVGVNITSKVAVPRISSRKSKQSRKRELRRQRSQQESDSSLPPSTTNEPDIDREDSEDKGMKIPYSPMRGIVAQPKLVPKWDYNQARRHRQMLQYLEVPQTIDALRHANSDTDFRTEDSDVFTNSDYTV